MHHHYDQEPQRKKGGIDYRSMPGYTAYTTLGEVFEYFQPEFRRKILTMHLTDKDMGDLVVHFPILYASTASIEDDGKVRLLTLNDFGETATQEFDAATIDFKSSVYHDNDLWFPDRFDPRIEWGVYDIPIEPAVDQK
jgi:hypothetical protein